MRGVGWPAGQQAQPTRTSGSRRYGAKRTRVDWQVNGKEREERVEQEGGGGGRRREEGGGRRGNSLLFHDPFISFG
eukprot:763310-Hanusia_phi.AAC.3